MTTCVHHFVLEAQGHQVRGVCCLCGATSIFGNTPETCRPPGISANRFRYELAMGERRAEEARAMKLNGEGGPV